MVNCEGNESESSPPGTHKLNRGCLPQSGVSIDSEGFTVAVSASTSVRLCAHFLITFYLKNRNIGFMMMLIMMIMMILRNDKRNYMKHYRMV